MNLSKDLHVCGICKKIFDDVNIFFEHKSNCFIHENTVKLDSASPSIRLLENELVSNGNSDVILEFTVPDARSFSFEQQYKEITCSSESNQLPVFQESLVQEKSNKSLTGNKNNILINIDEDINEKDIATLLATQFSKEGINFNTNSEGQPNQVPERVVTKVGGDAKENTLTTKSVKEKLPNMFKKDPEGRTSKATQKKICNVCSYEAHRVQDLKRHMRRHTGERPFVCPYCDKRFARRDKLALHKMMHSGEKPYECQICEYATTESAVLKKHMLIHTDERPYKCQVCSYRSRTSSHMVLHLRTHTGDSPFFCNVETCDRTFKTSTDLKRHLKQHKRDNSPPYSSLFQDMSEDYSCKHYLKSGKLPLHIASCYICLEYDHQGAVKRRKRQGPRVRCRKPHQCVECNAAFVRADSLRSHMRLHNTNATTVVDKSGDVGEPEKENLDRNESSDFVLPRDAANNTGCLEDSLVALDQDGAIHSVVNVALL